MLVRLPDATRLRTLVAKERTRVSVVNAKIVPALKNLSFEEFNSCITPQTEGFMTDDQTSDITTSHSPDMPTLPPIAKEDLPGAILQAMERAGWDDLTPVQSQSLPYLLKGRDLMVQSRTGSGKTGAFVLPILERLSSQSACQVLVLVPTRELAKQVAAEATRLVGDEDDVAVVYGGVGYDPQVKAFERGARIVVGTPGRILDHLLKGNLRLDDLQILVFDEADRMLSIGFYPDMRRIKTYLPRRDVNTMLFSATYPPFVFRLAGEFMRQPDMLSLSSKQVHVAEVQHGYYEVPRMGRERALIRIIEVEQPTSAIIFCNTKAQVEFVAQVLQNFGYSAGGLTGDLSQNKRERILTSAREGKLSFLVATDVAARGIDIPELSHVIQYEPPEDPESYIHRAGRTGRAGASGTAITLVDLVQKMEFERLAKRYEINLNEWPLPTDEDVSRITGERLLAQLEGRLRDLPPLAKERLKRFLPLAQDMMDSENGQPIFAMLLDEAYQGSLYTPPPLPELEQRRGRQPSRGLDDRAGKDGAGREGKDERDGRNESKSEGAPKPKRRRPRRKKKPVDKAE